jgi:hypothetical protein
MDDIIPTRREYRKMRSHFRLYALSRILIARNEERRLAEGLFLHDEYTEARVTVPSH